jgi:hypothetical protein
MSTTIQQCEASSFLIGMNDSGGGVRQQLGTNFALF